MASVGLSNCWFCSSSALTTHPLPNKRLNFACNFILPVYRNALKSSKVYCKQLPDTQSSGIDQNPTDRGASISRSKMEEYNIAMKRMMRSPYEYHHDLGMNYTLITDNLIVGSQPQMPKDIDHLKQEQNVAYILNLQQDKDIEYWGIDLQSIIIRCQELEIRHMRRPARDFDPDSLRSGLPKAVSSLEWAISKGKGKVYVHCTAGLGRAPAVAISYMFWFCGMNLNTAYDMLTAKRPCGPNRRAIRGATYDLAKNDAWKEPFESLPEYAFEDIADWERNLIQDRVHALRGS
ncbi:phosphoglucan phosphatase LSF2, chloroplastic [Juglans microcarpa x Juglans regia]|uniref:phosphoglucan phosphatase LSF2, chloroplastic n=1 Tax=Juglans microcarpa x Juglans regia TaxID=2249226 RepID=UPI001B7F0DAE|nr:phosphoglucan phosphatase LSF2, chloroplastic [Juglans microcarpa x Juglans regia]